MRKERQLRRKTERGFFACVLMCVAMASVHANAAKSGDETCGVIHKLGGDVQILDASREKLLPTEPYSSIACGSWVSTQKGWAKIGYHGGQVFRLGSNSFVQLLKSDGSAKGKDHVLLFRGQMHIENVKGGGEFRVLTANSRARFNGSGGGAKGIVIFNEEGRETQLISLHRKASLENRFEPSKPVVVSAGEATTLRLQSNSVIPLTPHAISLSGLKAKLEDLRLDEAEQKVAIQMAKSRQDRRLAGTIEKTGKGRAPASAGERADYGRSPASNREIEQAMMKKLLPFEVEAQRLVYPAGKDGGRKPASVNAGNSARLEDAYRAADAIARERKVDEQKERKRLIEELSRIQY